MGTATFSAGCGFAIALRDVLYQPIDCVVRVCGMIDRSRIQRPMERTRHHVVALGAVLSAHILNHANVAAFDDDFRCIVVPIKNRTEVRTLRVTQQIGSMVGSARQQNRRALRALRSFRNDDHCVQLDAVAHGDHHLALDVVEAVCDRSKRRRHFAGQAGRRRILSQSGFCR
jgi:hypothetical protein